MRLKIGFILRSLLAVGSFVGLVVLWSSLSPRLDDPSPLIGMRVSDPPAPSGGGDLQLVLFARASGGSRGRRGRARRWRRSSAGGAGAAGAGRGRRAPRSLCPRRLPPARPLAAPSSRASPPRAPPPLPALRLRLRRPRSPRGLLGGAGGARGAGARRRRGRSARGPSVLGPPRWRPGGAGGSGLRPAARAGLEEARCRRCHHWSGPGPSVRLPSRRRAVRGRPQLGAPPAGPPARELEGDGAPPLALAESAASPPTPVAGGRGATCGRGLAWDRRVLSLPRRGEGWRRGVTARPAAASPLLQGIPFSPGGGGAARPEN